MSSKIFYCTKVVAYGILCIITKLEFFQHQFSKMGHRNPSCDPHLHLSHSSYQRSATSREASAAGRLRPNAQTGQVSTTTIHPVFKNNVSRLKDGGREGIRTPGLLIANDGENKLRQGATIT